MIWPDRMAAPATGMSGSTAPRSASLPGGGLFSVASCLSIWPRSASASFCGLAIGPELVPPQPVRTATPKPTATPNSRLMFPSKKTPGINPGAERSIGPDLVDDGDFPARAGAGVLPEYEVHAVPDEPDRAVAHAQVDAARVVAGCGDVGPTEGGVA